MKTKFFLLCSSLFLLVGFASPPKQVATWILTPEGVAYKGKLMETSSLPQACNTCELEKEMRYHPQGPTQIQKITEDSQLRLLHGISSKQEIFLPNQEGKTTLPIRIDESDQAVYLAYDGKQLPLTVGQVSAFELYSKHYQLLILERTNSRVEYIWLNQLNTK